MGLPLLYPVSFSVFCLNTGGKKQSAIKCNSNLSPLVMWYLLFSTQYNLTGKKKIQSTVLIHEGHY